MTSLVFIGVPGSLPRDALDAALGAWSSPQRSRPRFQ